MYNKIQLVPYTDEYYDFVYEVKKNAYKKYYAKTLIYESKWLFTINIIYGRKKTKIKFENR